jgi:hypothetical protein
VCKRCGETYIGSVGNKLPKKDLLIAVERVDDKTKELINLSLESESLHLSSLLRLFHYHLTSLLLLLILRDDRHRFQPLKHEDVTKTDYPKSDQMWTKFNKATNEKCARKPPMIL